MFPFWTRFLIIYHIIHNNDIKNRIRELMEERIEIENEMSSYIKEKFYKAGFSDAQNLLTKNQIMH